jgi:catechol 2,3-dioxygenase-like lactoylglutathione lyase family enzyme
VSNATVRLGSVRIALVGKDVGRRILGWSLNGIASVELDGLPTTVSDTTTAHTQAAVHANGVIAIDHVVAMTPDLDRSVEVLQAAGLDLRRIREQPTPAGAPRQAFFRLGEVILEVVQEPEEALAARPDATNGPARFWGLALLSEDLDLTVEQLGEHVSEIRAAVQPGRRIATLRRSAGLAMPVALMSRADQ